MLTKQAQKLPALMAPGNAPMEGRTKALSPKQARQKMRSRKAPQNVFKPNDFHLLTAARPKVHLKKSVDSFSQEEIDVDKVYMHVKNNINYLPTFGSQKGALGCEIDGYGNSFDQAALMQSYIQGLYFTKLMFGELKLT